MNRLRWKLLVAMLAVVVLTIAISAAFTRRVTHDEFRRLSAAGAPPDLTPISDYYSRRHSWTGVEAVLDRMPRRVVLATRPTESRSYVGPTLSRPRRIIALPGDLRGSRVKIEPDGSVIADGHGLHVIVRVPPQHVGDADAYVFPPGQIGDTGSLDRQLLVTFSAAAIAATLLALFIARRITRPVERLTGAVDAMARGSVPAHVPVSGRDEIARLAASFNTMADALAKQQELRQRMVGDVAHELRTPLTNLRCELEALQDGLVRADAGRIASLHEEVLHLSRLVEDLQDLAVAEAGGLVLNLERIPLGDIVGRAAHSCGRAVHVSADDVVVAADPLRIGQIVRNLVANALRHARERVDVTVTRDGAFAAVAVADDGPGIPPAEIAHIFERFYRTDDARARADGGSGLGLAIVKQLVDRHGGRVWATNRPERGAVVTFTIPISD